jgi:hypothetical protein
MTGERAAAIVLPSPPSGRFSKHSTSLSDRGRASTVQRPASEGELRLRRRQVSFAECELLVRKSWPSTFTHTKNIRHYHCTLSPTINYLNPGPFIEINMGGTAKFFHSILVVFMCLLPAITINARDARYHRLINYANTKVFVGFS